MKNIYRCNKSSRSKEMSTFTCKYECGVCRGISLIGYCVLFKATVIQTTVVETLHKPLFLFALIDVACVKALYLIRLINQ